MNRLIKMIIVSMSLFESLSIDVWIIELIERGKLVHNEQTNKNDYS